MEQKKSNSYIFGYRYLLSAGENLLQYAVIKNKDRNRDRGVSHPYAQLPDAPAEVDIAVQ